MATESPDSPPVWLGRGRIPALDGLRAIAVLLVCFAHTYRTAGFPAIPGLNKIGHFGALGVDIFFVLSGFLITTLLYRERERLGEVSLLNFYLRRGIRILPSYVCFLLFVIALAATGFAAPSTRDWVAAGTYTMNFIQEPAWELGHTWSLSIEEHFYLIWPVAFIALPHRRAVAALIGVLIVGPVVRWAVLFLWPEQSRMTDLWTFTRLDTIAAGCLLGLLSRSTSGLKRLDTAARGWPLILILLVAGLAASSVSAKVAVGICPTITALSIAVLVWATARRSPRCLEHPVVVAIGVGSYSLYLWQQPFLNPHSPWWWSAYPQNLLFAGLAALTAYWLIERPVLRIKERFRPRPRRDDSGVVTG